MGSSPAFLWVPVSSADAGNFQRSIERMDWASREESEAQTARTGVYEPAKPAFSEKLNWGSESRLNLNSLPKVGAGQSAPGFRRGDLACYGGSSLCLEGGEGSGGLRTAVGGLPTIEQCPGRRP